MPHRFSTKALIWVLAGLINGEFVAIAAAESPLRGYFEAHCVECHNPTTIEAGLDLTSLLSDLPNELPNNPTKSENFARWVKIYDRIESGSMPPQQQPRPPAAETAAVVQHLKEELIQAEQAQRAGEVRTPVRRLTKAEYENTVRDLFDMPGIALQGELPADGSAHGFDKNSDALDISHVNLAKYMAAADHTLDLAIATQPKPPAVRKQRVSLANPAGFVAHVLMNGDGVLLKNKQPDPDFPPAGKQNHIDQGAHERLGSFMNGASVGLFRHEDEAFHPYFIEFVTLYPGRYRLRTSLWSFQWDKGKVLPGRGTEAARLSVVQLTGDGRGGGHPSYVLTYLDAPSLTEQEHELVTWLNFKETIGFNTASLAPTANYNREGRAMAFTGPGIACDWFDVEGPLHDVWPPAGHRQLFGDLPMAEFVPANHPEVRPPQRKPVRREVGAGKNELDPDQGLWTVASNQPLADAERLLARFLPKAFRRPVDAEVLRSYLARVNERMQAGDCFEAAMRWVYRAALCSPDFLYHIEPAGQLDDHALACRMSYFLWNSMPDDRLMELAAGGGLHAPDVLRAEVERMLKDPKSQRFIDDFLGQWLKLRQIAANDPDRKLYPEFSAYQQDSMVAESRAYFRELLEQNLDITHLVRSDFAMLNEKLAAHYGIPGVSGSQFRKVSLPPDSPRGGFLTQAAVLKVTANGTTTSPVPRGAFVMDRLLGEPSEPPPPNIPAVEPDVRGATTIREQLDKHRSLAACASCHAKIDPPGFALETFDVIGGFRTRYRSIGGGDPAERGAIDPFIPISFTLGPAVDASGVLPDGRMFGGIAELQALLAADEVRLLKNLARQFLVYSTGREVSFGDRAELAGTVDRTRQAGSGIRSLLHEVVQSPLFQTK